MADRLPSPAPFTRMPPVTPPTKRSVAREHLLTALYVPAAVVFHLGPAALFALAVLFVIWLFS